MMSSESLLYTTTNDTRSLAKTPTRVLEVLDLEFDVADFDKVKMKLDGTLGTFSGCFVPCLLNIVGIILFMRIPWAVGQIGVTGIIGYLVVGSTMSYLTALSLSALATNGRIEGGGIYFMVSRTLGAALGGAIGMMFYVGYSIGVAFYSLGFGIVIQSTFIPVCSIYESDGTDWFDSCIHADHKHLVQGGVASILLLLVMIISLNGAHARANADLVFFVVQMLAILYGLISLFVPHDLVAVSTFTGQVYDNATVSFPSQFENNLYPQIKDDDSCPNGECSFHAICATLFPMFSGILSGANLSADMKNPSESIPKGTLWAITTAVGIYALQIFALAGSVQREVLHNDQAIFQEASLLTPLVVVVGTVVSVGSSALGQLYGASKLLQAMAEDDISVLLSPFKAKKIPRVAICTTWLMAQSVVLAGDLDVVAPIITSIFCLSWGVTNLTCGILSSVGTPNFRPTFKFFSGYSAYAGCFLCIFMMMFLDWFYGLLSVVFFLAVTLYFVISAPAKDWGGDMSQEIMFHQVRSLLLGLNGTTSKLPHVLCLADNVNLGVLGFCNQLKKGGLLVIGQTLPGTFSEFQQHRIPMLEGWRRLCKTTKLNALPQLNIAPTAALGNRILAESGACGLQLNTVALTLPPAEIDDKAHASQYRKLTHAMSHPDISRSSACFPFPGFMSDSDLVLLMEELLCMRKNILLCSGFGSGCINDNGMIVSELSVTHDVIDVWLPDAEGLEDHYLNDSVNSDGTDKRLQTLLVHMGETFQLSQSKKRMRLLQLLRIQSVDSISILNAKNSATSRTIDMLANLRIKVKAEDVIVLTLDDVRLHSKTYAGAVRKQISGLSLPQFSKLSKSKRIAVKNELMNALSRTSMQIFAPLPNLKGLSSTDLKARRSYIEDVRRLTAGLPPTVLVGKGEEKSVLSGGLYGTDA